MTATAVIRTELVAGAVFTLGFDWNSADQRVTVMYMITLPDLTTTFTASDLTVLTRATADETMNEAFRAFFSFLSASAESGSDGENSDLFPEDVRLWAEENSDDITMLSLEPEEYMFL